MAKRKSGSTRSRKVVSLEQARAFRELEEAAEDIRGQTARTRSAIAEIVDLYHRWEAANPDKTVSALDKMEMIAYGFLGEAGFNRCHDEYRLPGLALYGMQAKSQVFDDDVLAERIMCPALESGRCRDVTRAIDVPPCILLGGEVQQAVAPQVLSSLGEHLMERDWRDPPALEKRRFARAKALVDKHRKLEEQAERRHYAKLERERRRK